MYHRILRILRGPGKRIARESGKVSGEFTKSFIKTTPIPKHCRVEDDIVFGNYMRKSSVTKV